MKLLTREWVEKVEKYIKGRLVEADLYFKKTHDLGYLLALAAQVEPLWAAYEQELRLLTDTAWNFGTQAPPPTLTSRRKLENCVRASAKLRGIVWAYQNNQVTCSCNET